MPLYNDQKPVQPTIPVPPEVTNPVPLDTASSFGSFQYSGSPISYLNGTPWTCTYYCQYLSNDDIVGNSQDHNDATIKQYQKINDFEIRVTDALSNNIEASTGKSTVSGRATVYPVITPIVGDVFVAISSGNIYGIFEITNIERLSLYKESAWSISYIQIGYTLNPIAKQCEKYVISEFGFDASKLDTGSNPLFSTNSDVWITDKNAVINDLVNTYYNSFYDNRVNTFLVPETETHGRVYDPFIVDFWNTVVGSNFNFSRPNPISYSTKNGFVIKPFFTIFDALLKQSPAILKNTVKVFKLLPKSMFYAEYQRHTLMSSGIDYVVYPYLDTNRIEKLRVEGPIPNKGLELDDIVSKLNEDIFNLNSIINHDTANTDGSGEITDYFSTFYVKDGYADDANDLSGYYVHPGDKGSEEDDAINYFPDEYVEEGYAEKEDIDNKDNQDCNDSEEEDEDIDTDDELEDRELYIFGREFYKNLAGQTTLESLLTNAINRRAISLKDIKLVIDMLPNTSTKKQFYYIPLIIVLLTIAR